ncbi:MAG TPA: hypothetical protein VGW80_11065 [Solirubrobacterales bacterium]|jgi:hypothetical protein|nr:hypothetical protein [Solirubrobacterales bacterium]
MRHRKNLLFAQFKQLLLILKARHLLLATLDFSLKLIDRSARLSESLGGYLNTLLKGCLVPRLPKTEPLKQERNERRSTGTEDCEELNRHRQSYEKPSG